MASPEIQIFVKWEDGKTRTVHVLPSDTIAEVKRKLREKLDTQPEEIALVYQSKRLADDRTVESCGIKKESTLMGGSVASLLDQPVLTQLKDDLLDLTNNLGEKHFVFIGLGSYDNGHGTDSIKRQQCPDKLLNWCRSNAWDLTIILVDPDFRTQGVQSPQVYDLASQGWSSQPSLSALGGKVRVYKNLNATYIEPASPGHARSDMRVITYGTGIPEYHPLHSLTDRKKIAGMPVIDLFRARFANAGLREACVVSGNFFQDPTPPGQYCTLGDPGILAACGFTFNP